jgi:hypothetical protein
MAEPQLYLFSHALLSKWGFDDGDPFDEVEDWWHNQHGTGPMGHCDCGFFDLGVDARVLLPELVRRFLLPALDQAVELVDIETSHNPIRASKVNGVDVEGAWYESSPAVVLTPESVVVPYSTVVEVAAELREHGDG